MTHRKASLSNGALDALLVDLRPDILSVRDNHRSPHPDPDKLLEYTTRSGPSLVSKQVEQHLSECSDCSSRLDAFKAAAQVWEGSEGDARIERIRKRLHPTGQRELVFPVADNPCVGANGNSTKVRLSHPKTERSIHEWITRQILRDAEAIETQCDYVLPNGLHSDTHINLGRICRSESTLAPIVRVLDEMLTGRNFDTLVSTSWALATIARRLV